MTDNNDNERPLTFLETLSSVFAAMFGVQKQEMRERDFRRGKLSHFIAVGVLFTVVFILTVWAIVKLVMNLAGV
ncbi:MAG: DUF2970 domain-containing protein [Chromatiales bacterium]|nr:DUF2970 domain-containing protein [Chromatiales bacterium]